MIQLDHCYVPKDFIETAEGLCFAVVQQGTESFRGKEKVLTFLRYVKRDGAERDGWQKLNTKAANDFLRQYYQDYLYHSSFSDADLHGVDTDRIVIHHNPRVRLQQILSAGRRDKVEQDLYALCRLFMSNGIDLTTAGVTGSLLINAQQSNSDIDLVFYGRNSFHKARAVTAALIEKQQMQTLAESDWQEAYDRRSCALILEDYVRHERRKFNKGLINGRKFDLTLVVEPVMEQTVNYRKCGEIVVCSTITADRQSFDYPAVYGISHETVREVVCFTATYTGQAVTGETVEISGLLEQADNGSQRIVVGSSREAPGEYIKVIV